MNRPMARQLAATLAASALLTLVPMTAPAGARAPQAQAAPTQVSTQGVYPSPEAAAKALREAVASHDLKAVFKVLGPGSEPLIHTGDEVADQQMRERFVAAYDKSLKIERTGNSKALLVVGENDFPFPFPVVKGAQGWRFDSRAGAEEIINRRIGENELYAIQACLAYGDAQREYAERDRTGDGLLQYAQKFRSSEGKHDGLYWPVKDGEPPSPLGPLVAQATREGYSAKGSAPVPLHGYYYRILTGQGKGAKGGAYDYLVKGKMIGGYALAAYPSNWGSSGVMTFICNQDGVVYQKNLGRKTAELASKMTRYNPDQSWTKVKK